MASQVLGNIAWFLGRPWESSAITDLPHLFALSPPQTTTTQCTWCCSSHASCSFVPFSTRVSLPLFALDGVALTSLWMRIKRAFHFQSNDVNPSPPLPGMVHKSSNLCPTDTVFKIQTNNVTKSIKYIEYMNRHVPHLIFLGIYNIWLTSTFFSTVFFWNGWKLLLGHLKSYLHTKNTTLKLKHGYCQALAVPFHEIGW